MVARKLRATAIALTAGLAAMMVLGHGATAHAANATSATSATNTETSDPPGWRAVQAGTFSPLDRFHAGFGFGSGIGWVTDEAARANLVGKTGPTFHLDVGADIYDLVTLEGSLGTIFLKDDGAYQETVIDQDGVVFDADSSLSLTVATLAAGLRTPDLCLAANQQVRGGWLALFGYVRLGHAWVGGGREIGNCIDCRRETLATPGGTFLEPGLSIGLKANDSWGFSLVSSYRGYFSGTVASEWRIGLMISNW